MLQTLPTVVCLVEAMIMHTVNVRVVAMSLIAVLELAIEKVVAPIYT
ncbi:hypothetical protein SAMN04490239_0635 [Rhodococcus koreensis]|uniref:Uncharacterized protein n=1 Tax=Rhodococcus koreensis TaxID=99653 RepID=A0A1H4IHE1_9NOCA|nr:hypothetical protein SAMN04490239_0635 [Rhodococcus koreensis]